MKQDMNKLTLWVGFLNVPTDKELQEAANTMKGGKGYVFKDFDGLLVMYNHRRLNEYAARNKTFIKRIIAND